MMKFFTQMLRFPLTVFVSTMEAFAGVMRDIQRTTDQTIDAMAGGVARVLGNESSNKSGSADSRTTGGIISDHADQTTLKEECKMSDQDLSGPDLKYVSYSILFTKPDLEATLEHQEEDLVNYSTDGASLGALKIAEFFGKVRDKKYPRPKVWKENGYPEGASDNNWEIPDEDQKYIQFIYTVDRRLAKNDPNYPKEQVKVLKEIRDRLAHKAVKA